MKSTPAVLIDNIYYMPDSSHRLTLCGSLFSGLVTGFSIDGCVYLEFTTCHPLKQLICELNPRVDLQHIPSGTVTNLARESPN